MESRAIWKSRPVFITSTFQDMQAERDHLRDFVFPALEEWLRGKRRHLEWIDLRVGVATAGASEEEARELQVLKVCLDEVKRSRPFLIGLIGDRYGWVPPKQRVAAAAAEAGISGDVTDRSVTDLEIDFGVFHDEEQQRRSLFFFRAPLPYDKMPPEKAAEYSDAHATDPGAASRVRQLKKLKVRIEDELPGRWFDYEAEWDADAGDGGKVTGLKAWGEDVQAKIKQAIEEDLADEPDASTEQTDDEIERDALVDFAEDRARDFTGRTDVLKDIEALLASPATEDTPRGLCLTGEAGSGKSALFAALHQGLTGVEKDADARMSDEQRALYARLQGMDALVLAHAAGASPRAPSVDAMLRRWIAELAGFLGVDPALPENAGADEVDAAFASLLGRAALKRRVIVLVDALDQFEATPRGRFVTWLPRLWPENARLIATAIPGEASAALAQRPGMTPRPLPPLDADEARDIAVAITARYHRELEPEVLDALISDPGEANTRWRNPLWLVLAVEELNLLDADDFARARQLPAGRDDERLRALMCGMATGFPADIAGLYQQTFERAAVLFGSKLTEAFLGVIAVSRSGWRESDFRVVLPRLSGEAWDELRFAQLRRLFRGQLRQQGAMGQWDVMHTQMRKAITRCSLSDPLQIRVLHLMIVAYLASLPQPDPLTQSEMMFHLIGSGERWLTARYYGGVMSQSENAGATAILTNHILAGASQEPNPNLAWILSLADQELLEDRTGIGRRFLMDLDEALAGSAPVNARLELLRICESVFSVPQGGDDQTFMRYLGIVNVKIGDLLRTLGDSLGAQISYRAALSLAESLAANPTADWQVRNDLAVANDRIGRILEEVGDMDAAGQAYEVGIAATERLLAETPTNKRLQRDLAGRRMNLARFLSGQGQTADAEKECRSALALFEALSDVRVHKQPARLSDPDAVAFPRDLYVAHFVLGEVLAKQGDLEESLRHHRTALDIAERCAARDPTNRNWLEDQADSGRKISIAMMADGDRAGALTVARVGLAIDERLASTDLSDLSQQVNLATTQQFVADLMVSLKLDAPTALGLYRAAISVRQRAAAADPGNPIRWRDLAVTSFRLTRFMQLIDDRTGTALIGRACRQALLGVQKTGMSLDKETSQMLIGINRLLTELGEMDTES